MNATIGTTNEHNDKQKLMILWCHKEINGTVGTYPYRRISDEIQRLIQDHGIADTKVHRLEPAKVSSASNRRRLPNGKVVWLDKKAHSPWNPTDTLFSLNYAHGYGKGLFVGICDYLASIPDMNGRWEMRIVDDDSQTNWRVSANEETYVFLANHWAKIPYSDPMFLTECSAEQVKEWLLDSYEWKQRKQKVNNKTYNTRRTKWLYIEEGNVIQSFYERSELAQFLHTSDTPREGIVKLVYEDDLRQRDVSTAVNESAKEFLTRYEQFHPLFPPRDHEVSKRLRETRYIVDGQKCTAKDLWERRYRSQIDNLIHSGTENHIAALTLMMPCMDLVYKLKTGENKSEWTEVMKMFFPAIGFTDDTYHQLRRLVRNGFVHEGIAQGYVGISSVHREPEEYADSEQVFQGMRSETGQFYLLIIPAFFWARVRDKIDSFYKYEQWIRGWDMHTVLTFSDYVEPLNREDIN